MSGRAGGREKKKEKGRDEGWGRGVTDVAFGFVFWSSRLSGTDKLHGELPVPPRLQRWETWGLRARRWGFSGRVSAKGRGRQQFPALPRPAHQQRGRPGRGRGSTPGPGRGRDVTHLVRPRPGGGGAGDALYSLGGRGGSPPGREELPRQGEAGPQLCGAAGSRSRWCTGLIPP